jgi:hypothetical protein
MTESIAYISFSTTAFISPEGNSGSFVNNNVVTLTRTGDLSETQTVQVVVNSASPGSAVGGDSISELTDYNNTSFPITVTFNPGEETQTVEIPIYGDTTVEASDTIGLELINPSEGVSLGVSTATLTIQNDDSRGLLDIVFVQDLSGSFGDDIATVRGLIPALITNILSFEPSAQFAVASFVDKPIYPFGSAGSDYVYRTDLPLTANLTDVQSTYDNLVILNGGDWPESQLEALMQTGLRTGELGFRPDSQRLAIIFTDAPYHFAGDGALAGIYTPNNGDAILDGTPAGTGEDYPGIAQVASILSAAGVRIVPVFAVTPENISAYESLISQLGGNGSVVALENNSSNIVSAVQSALGNVVNISVDAAPGLFTTEAGGTATFTVSLTSQPTADVIIPISSSDPTEGEVSVTSLVFTPTNFNVPQTITVTGVNDDLNDGDVSYLILTGEAISEDPNYSGRNAGNVAITNVNDDIVAILQVRLNLLADNDGTPGEIISNNQVGLNRSFFVEIQVADLRGNAAGVNGLGLNLAWDGLILESIDTPFDPANIITANFPLLQDGTVDNSSGLINNLSGGSLPAFELGQAIGVNQLERFALLRFQTENSTGTYYFTTTVDSAALADDLALFDPNYPNYPSYSLDVETSQPILIGSVYSQYNFTYNYGNGDSYTGYVYAVEGTYTAGQTIGNIDNETGNYGYYTIDSIASTTLDSSYNNRVYVASYTDGDTGYGTTTNISSGTGYSGLGSESGNAYDVNGNSADSYFSQYSEADILANQKYNFTYSYGNGDSYSGYGYAAVGTYTAGQALDGYANETGYTGQYTIDSVELGNTNAGYNNLVYVTSYTDGDTGYGTTTNISSGIGYSGLGSESGNAYDASGNSSDPYFSNSAEADIQNQLFNYTYTYGNGDSYSGYGYALAGTYTAGQVLGGYANETVNIGYYTIDSVSAGTTDSFYNNHVYVTSYTDGDTLYGKTTNLYSDDGGSGLGSEYGHAYTAEGNSYDSFFGAYPDGTGIHKEADLVIPGLAITDNSGNANDSSIKFTTELSQFRKGHQDSDYVRPNYADTTKYFDITNTGTGVLVVSDIQINVSGVTVNLDLSGDKDLLVNPGSSQRVNLTYDPLLAGENFDVANGLVLFTNIPDWSQYEVKLSGKSTFNSDINYDGKVNTGDLGSLNQARTNFNRGIFDGTADITGDGLISTLDASALTADIRLKLSV